jgi:predicted PurR-regulated permease PerM
LTALPAKTWRWSYVAIPAVVALAGMLGLGGMLLAILFSFFLLSKLRLIVAGQTWAAVALFVALAAGISYGAGYFLRQTARELPEIVDKSVPAIADWAQQHGITIPFTDYDSLKELVVTTTRSGAGYLGEAARLARGAAEDIALLVVGVVVAIALFVNVAALHRNGGAPSEAANLNELASAEFNRRFRAFYLSFATIMGAQLTIATINTILTTIFVLATGLPHAVVMIGVTFLCGMLPVVGNLISNAIMVCIAFTVSPREALIALAFLVIVHKLEYILNSRIVGRRIHLPIWLILLSLIVGEKIMGVTGMILAPVLFHYIRTEAALIPVS